MYVCVYVCMYVRIVCIGMCVCMYVCTRVFMCCMLFRFGQSVPFTPSFCLQTLECINFSL